MIALQDEMDWLVYAAYGLMSLDHPAVGAIAQGSPKQSGGGPVAPTRIFASRRSTARAPFPRRATL